MRLRNAAVSALAVGSVLLTGCSSSQVTTASLPSSTTAASTPSATPSSSASPSSSVPATMSPEQQRQALAQAYAQFVEPKLPANTPLISGSYGTKPTIKKPVGAEPKKMIVKDLKVGTGKAAPIGATVTINYLGVGWVDGVTFDTSFGKAPATFPLGNLIPGWQIGIPGMKEGGRRELVIPGQLAYAAGSGSPLAGKTLVFVIDLQKVA